MINIQIRVFLRYASDYYLQIKMYYKMQYLDAVTIWVNQSGVQPV